MSRQDPSEMDPLARKALTDSALSEYRQLRGLKAKEDFEAVMAYAQAEGAIMALRPRRDPQGLIERIATSYPVGRGSKKSAAPGPTPPPPGTWPVTSSPTARAS